MWRPKVQRKEKKGRQCLWCETKHYSPRTWDAPAHRSHQLAEILKATSGTLAVDMSKGWVRFLWQHKFAEGPYFMPFNIVVYFQTWQLKCEDEWAKVIPTPETNLIVAPNSSHTQFIHGTQPSLKAEALPLFFKKVGNSKKLSDIPKVTKLVSKPEHKPTPNINKPYILAYTSLPFKNSKNVSV